MKVAILLAAALAAAQAQDSAQVKTEAPAAATSEQVENVKGQVDGLNESYLETKATVDKLAKIKLSGYIQAQWQHADSDGVAGFSGGNFPANSNQRFQVRRGRLKTTYENGNSKYVLQFDVVPSGLSIKDAYGTYTEPWLKALSLTLGVHDRPFGFEISNSSSSRESPERSRVFQTLFPGERDLGAKLEINPGSDMGFLQYLSLKAGAYTGMGPTANEIDKEQDLIGRIGFKAPFYDLNLSIDGGFSAYIGKIVDANAGAFNMGDTSFIPTPLANDTLQPFDRKVMGADVQLYYDLPVVGGLSLRGEYLWGEMPGTQTANGPYGASTAAVYNRKFMGWYGMWVQNLGPLIQAVLKYDQFDPNTGIEGENMRGGNFRPADLMYSTLGYGVVIHLNENTKFTVYNDVVTNEEAGGAVNAASGLIPYTKDLNDNVFTFRMQVKF